MALKYANNAKTTLNGAITDSATSITVTNGAVFPSLSGGDYFYMTLEDVTLQNEIVKVTARSGNDLTIVRAQNGTTAKAFADADKAEGRVVTAILDDLGALVGGVTPSAFFLTLVDDTTAGAALTTLGLSSAAQTFLATPSSANLRALVSDESGTGALLFAGGALGAATATSINGLTITSSTGTFTLTNSKTFSVSNTLTLAGTDGSTLNIGAGGTLGTAAFKNTGTSGNNVPLLDGANAWSADQSRSSAAGTERSFRWQTAGVDRWTMFANSVAESGANAGSNFSIAAWSDAGAFIGDAITITRASRAVNIHGSLSVSTDPVMTRGAAESITGVKTLTANTPLILRSDQSALHHKDAAGTDRFLLGIRSDITSNTTDYVLYSLGVGTVWKASQATRLMEFSGRVSALGGGSTIPAVGSPTGAALLASYSATFGLLMGARSSDGAGWLQAQKVNGDTDVYPLLLNPNGGVVYAGNGTDTPVSGYSGLKVKVSGSTAGVTVRRDGYGEVALMSGGYNGVGTITNHSLDILVNNSPIAQFSTSQFGVNTNVVVGNGNTGGVGRILIVDGADNKGSYISFREGGGTRWHLGRNITEVASDNNFGLHNGSVFAWYTSSSALTTTFNYNVTAPDFVISSDERLKSDFVPFTNALDIVRQLRTGEYTRISTGKREYGFMAQDFERAGVPLFVDNTASGKSLKYPRTSALLAAAIKELLLRVEALEAK